RGFKTYGAKEGNCARRSLAGTAVGGRRVQEESARRDWRNCLRHYRETSSATGRSKWRELRFSKRHDFALRARRIKSPGQAGNKVAQRHCGNRRCARRRRKNNDCRRQGRSKKTLR